MKRYKPYFCRMTDTGLGKKIQIARKKAGLTQEQAAKALKTTREGYARWEGKKSNPLHSTILEIAKAFGCVYEDDFKFKDEDNANTNNSG